MLAKESLVFAKHIQPTVLLLLKIIWCELFASGYYPELFSDGFVAAFQLNDPFRILETMHLILSSFNHCSHDMMYVYRLGYRCRKSTFSTVYSNRNKSINWIQMDK